MKPFALFAAILLSSTAALAQSAPVPTNNNNQPIEITATETVEWLRNEKQYVARKDVIVKQGPMEIHSDLLTADYREGQASSMEIWQMTAEGNVQIKDETNTAYGDKGVYDVTNGVAVLTGQDLKLVSPDQTVTASERMEYHANQRMAKAIGNATVKRARDTVKADTLTAYFKDDSAAETQASAAANSPLGGGGNIDRLEADGNVVIITPTEKLYGSKAIYNAATNTATMSGNVKIERGENTLEGARAEVDLTTNVSKMFGSEKTGGRVRGVFFPGSESRPGAKGQGLSAAIPAPSQVPAAVSAATAPAKPPGSAAPVPAPPAAQPVSPTPAAPAPAKVSPRIEY